MDDVGVDGTEVGGFITAPSSRSSSFFLFLQISDQKIYQPGNLPTSVIKPDSHPFLHQ